MGRAKVGRRGQKDDVDFGIDQVPAGVEADEPMIPTDGHAVGKSFLEKLDAPVKAIGENVADGHQLGVLVGVEGIGGCPGASTATADESDLERVGTCCVGASA